MASALAGLCAAGCGPRLAVIGHGSIRAVGAENEYADIISQVGGRYVTVTAIIDNPNTDPHAFESSPTVARAVASARLVVQNGLGYDEFMSRTEAAVPNAQQRVIDVQRLLGMRGGASNPHLWYGPATMPTVAAAVGRALSRIAPDHAAYFQANARRFDSSLKPWYRELSRVRRRFGGAPVATSEPVADYLLAAAGVRVLTPFDLQLDIMNGTDPAPQGVSRQDALLSRRQVRAFLYNRQVTDSITQGFVGLARSHRVPTVGVYETMPAGFDYQRWMLSTTLALERALSRGV